MAIGTTQLNEETAELSAALLSAMAHPIRLAILMLLSEEELAVNAVASRLEIRRSLASQHLGKLKIQRLVTTRRDKRTVYCSCQSQAAGALLRALNKIVFMA
ncbi:winged helix-turn-helix transcriptional regulator [Agrobacterium rhizogenes]|uniref:ArsR/SmtB family transcription factor n=1 Tax=Rhizobium rhizogenes TaxID=359 RepID=UPI001573E931|nr:metalloregulator ArsR/SmtB family transcription factor [Rhizobium rhizogenes]NTH16786.1 winged helix-turn-helix transcriptional regulator [Rhizobium rhizogenes]NTI78216.1 winged helix-turn-helix transcriptional regulator [Rhizobium rhizogenes]